MGNKSGKSEKPPKQKKNKKGNKGADPSGHPQPLPATPGNLMSESDYSFLTAQTGLSKQSIEEIFDQFMKNNPDALLNKNEFKRIYNQLRPEPPELLDEISDYVFRAFDSDHNGTIDFQEFLIAYSLTSRGDLTKKLEYAFMLYDFDNNGYLDKDELREVITGMLDLLGADKRTTNPAQLADECIRELDVTNDGRVSRSEFINGLMRNYSLRALMSPFN